MFKYWDDSKHGCIQETLDCYTSAFQRNAYWALDDEWLHSGSSWLRNCCVV